MIIIGIDDTDTATSRGTGALARQVAANLAADHPVLGVIRQQLLRDPRVPCTKNNSSKAILLEDADGIDLAALAARVRDLMLADYQPGSDPGLCIAGSVPAEVVEFGIRAQRELLTQAEARELAARHGIHLEGLGGDEMGVIGALAAVGLTAGGDAGRYIQVGQVRSLAGSQPVESVLAAGVAAVQTPEGDPVTTGVVQTDGLRPARRGGRSVAVVRQEGDEWWPLKLD
jgi:hypothetical protein